MRVIYPGSFDPVTNGHLDIINRSSSMFDEVVVAVLDNRSKTPLFSIEERVELIENATSHLNNVKIDRFEGLLVDYIETMGIYTVLRGLRAVSDYESEIRNALANKNLNNKVETIFMVSKAEYTFLSSSVVKEIASFGGNVKNIVPPNVNLALSKKYKQMEE